MSISIVGFDKAAVLAALYNAAQPQGMGFIQYDPTPMTVEQAKAILDSGRRPSFDYMAGRVMKLDLSSDSIEPGAYDRDNGKNAAQRVIDSLKASGDVNNPVIAGIHKCNAKVQAMQARANLDEKTTFDGNVARLGLDDMAPVLGPRIDQVLKG